jgi:hypothetical protein
MLSDLRSNER